MIAVLLAVGLVGVTATIVHTLIRDEPLTRPEREFLAATLGFITGCILLTLAALTWLP